MRMIDEISEEVWKPPSDGDEVKNCEMLFSLFMMKTNRKRAHPVSFFYDHNGFM